jgi:hypothetical protein
MHVHKYVPCRSTHPRSVAVTPSGVYRHLRCMSLDRNCTCLTSLGLDHVKWNMRQLRALRSRFTTGPHDFGLCWDRDIEVMDKTEHFYLKTEAELVFETLSDNTRQRECFFCHFKNFFSPFRFLHRLNTSSPMWGFFFKLPYLPA